MIAPERLYYALREAGISFFAGVPDSVLRGFCSCVESLCDSGEHVGCPNEGSAISLATGYHLATNRIAVVYMQNSGLGNAVNPLTSLTHPDVYRIPALLIVGWRGEPGTKDEPQHMVQGGITTSLLDLLSVPYEILGGDSDVDQVVRTVLKKIGSSGGPAALLVRSDALGAYPGGQEPQGLSRLVREDAVRQILHLSDPEDVFIATTGKISRELFELRVERKEEQRDFLTVGSMGHASSIALGVAQARPNRRVICMDGDGAMLMHMGVMPTIGTSAPRNLIHIILNNGAHESVGGQPTVARQMDLNALARASGYASYYHCADASGVAENWDHLTTREGPILWEIKVAMESRSNLGRPTSGPQENKEEFKKHVAR